MLSSDYIYLVKRHAYLYKRTFEIRTPRPKRIPLGASWTTKEMSDVCEEIEYILKRVRNELIWEEGKMFVHISDYLAGRHQGNNKEIGIMVSKQWHYASGHPTAEKRIVLGVTHRGSPWRPMRTY